MVEIDGKPLRPVDTDHGRIVLAFDAARGNFSGTSGCNDLKGRFDTTGYPLTLMSDKSLQLCRGDEETQRAMKSVLRDTRAYRVSSTTLELLDAKGERLAKFER